MVIKRVSPMSVAKVSFVLYAAIGFIIGGIFALFGAAFGSLAALSGGRNHMGLGFPEMFFGVGAIIVLPIFYGVMAAIFSAIGAFIYNIVAGWVGGIEIEVQ
jgi:hypothetical protein